MTIDYRNRDQLYRSAVEVLGREEADTLMASLPPMDWSEMATKSDLRELELRLTSHFDRSLRQQTQWVVGALGAMAVSMLGVVVSILTLG